MLINTNELITELSSFLQIFTQEQAKYLNDLENTGLSMTSDRNAAIDIAKIVDRRVIEMRYYNIRFSNYFISLREHVSKIFNSHKPVRQMDEVLLEKLFDKLHLIQGVMENSKKTTKTLARVGTPWLKEADDLVSQFEQTAMIVRDAMVFID